MRFSLQRYIAIVLTTHPFVHNLLYYYGSSLFYFVSFYKRIFFFLRFVSYLCFNAIFTDGIVWYTFIILFSVEEAPFGTNIYRHKRVKMPSKRYWIAVCLLFVWCYWCHKNLIMMKEKIEKNIRGFSAPHITILSYVR